MDHTFQHVTFAPSTSTPMLINLSIGPIKTRNVSSSNTRLYVYEPTFSFHITAINPN